MSTRYRWVSANMGIKRGIPLDAVLAGRDIDGNDILVARAQHENETLPATVIPRKDICVVTAKGEVHQKYIFEVLVPTIFIWRPAKNGNVPDNALEAGKTGGGDKLYFGRVDVFNLVMPVKIHPKKGCAYYSYNFYEMKTKEYEVLCINDEKTS